MSIFKPSKIARSIYEIDGETLQQAGIKGIILDWTNTITTKNAESITDLMKDWLNNMQSRYGIKVIIVSNSKPPMHGHGQINEIPALFEAGKPKKKAFLAALNLLGTRSNETAVIGNGIISDLWGGNRLGMYTIFISASWAKPRILGVVKRLFVKVLRV